MQSAAYWNTVSAVERLLRGNRLLNAADEGDTAWRPFQSANIGHEGAAMISGFAAAFAGSAWMRTLLHYGVIALTIFLFLVARANAPVGWPHTDDRLAKPACDQDRVWPTPMANDRHRPSAGNRRTPDPTHASHMWLTPTARDHKDGVTSLANTPVNGLLGCLVLATPMAESDTSERRRTLTRCSSRR